MTRGSSYLLEIVLTSEAKHFRRHLINHGSPTSRTSIFDNDTVPFFVVKRLVCEWPMVDPIGKQNKQQLCNNAKGNESFYISTIWFHGDTLVFVSFHFGAKK